MPFEASCVPVVIASPREAAEERGVVRDVIREWNARNARGRSQVLLPIDWVTDRRDAGADLEQLLQNADLLVAVFRTQLGAPAGTPTCRTIDAIEDFHGGGKPALFCFRDPSATTCAVDPMQFAAMSIFRESLRRRALCWSFNGPEALREELTWQLGQKLELLVPDALKVPTSVFGR